MTTKEELTYLNGRLNEIEDLLIECKDLQLDILQIIRDVLEEARRNAG